MSLSILSTSFWLLKNEILRFLKKSSQNLDKRTAFFYKWKIPVSIMNIPPNKVCFITHFFRNIEISIFRVMWFTSFDWSFIVINFLITVEIMKYFDMFWIYFKYYFKYFWMFKLNFVGYNVILKFIVMFSYISLVLIEIFL